MIKIFNVFFWVIFELFLINCGSQNTNNLQNTNYEVSAEDTILYPLGLLTKNDTLKISIEFSECGEWGGHRESIHLQRNIDNKVMVHYTVDSVSCNKTIGGILDNTNRIIILDTMKVISHEDEKLLSIFLQRLFELYLSNGICSNSGDVYVIITSSGLRFSYWNSCSFDTYYMRVKKQILGDLYSPASLNMPAS